MQTPRNNVVTYSSAMCAFCCHVVRGGSVCVRTRGNINANRGGRVHGWRGHEICGWSAGCVGACVGGSASAWGAAMNVYDHAYVCSCVRVRAYVCVRWLSVCCVAYRACRLGRGAWCAYCGRLCKRMYVRVSSRVRGRATILQSLLLRRQCSHVTSSQL